ncbi:transglutaminase domain-containing protein [Polaribacter aquimarinus]|nr:transglutaminase domain-containing protein [Polaribacter aquimarinus]
MQKIGFFLLFFFVNFCFAQQSDFKHIDFTKADYIAKTYKTKKLLELNKTTHLLTKNLETDVEKLRAIYLWICTNIANDFSLYALNNRKRKRFLQDSIKLEKWNSKFKKVLFKKLLRRKKTICTGYAYLLKEMCTIAGIESKMVNGIGRTSSVDLSVLKMPNHTWNIVKLNNKWYLCDPTWSTGISFPEEGRFQFQYNDGYFLTDPKLFFHNHYPIKKEFSLIENKSTSFLEFSELPLLYNDAFVYLKKHISPSTMYHVIKQGSAFNFQYKLNKKVMLKNVKLVYFKSDSEIKLKPKIELKENLLKITHTFKRKGFYDIHLYIDKKIIATYTFKVLKND